MKRTLLFVSRAILSVLFIFSGFTKWVDPVGSQIKFEEYFRAFSLDALAPLSWVAAVVMPAAELFIGVMLSMGLYRRFTAWMSLLFMSFFTLLTFFTWKIFPVSDCGCFGDFITLTNAQTFFKNVVFMVPTVMLFAWYGRGESGSDRDMRTTLLLAAWTLLLPVYTIGRLPLLDFLPYDEGVNIEAAMSVPEGADRGEHRTRLLYRDLKSGEERLFEIEDTTWYDTTRWEYVETVDEVVREGYTPPIASFSAVDVYGAEHGAELLQQRGYVALIVIKDLKKTERKVFRKNLDSLRALSAKGVKLAVLTQLDIAAVSERIGGDIPCYNMDETQLKSIVRSKSGVVFLYDGTIVAKRNMLTSLPSLDEKSPAQVIKAEKRRSMVILCVYLSLYFVLAFMRRLEAAKQKK